MGAEVTKGTSTFGITLKWGASASAMTQKVRIKDYPDLGGSPEMIDITTLSDPVRVNMLGIQALDALEFTANYNKEDFDAVNADARKDLFYALEFGKNGSEGVFEWQGQHAVYPVGGDVNAAVDMKIVVAATTAPAMKTDAGA